MARIRRRGHRSLLCTRQRRRPERTITCCEWGKHDIAAVGPASAAGRENACADGRRTTSKAVMTLARWPDDALEVLREARDGFMASLEGPSDPDQKTDFSLVSNALKHMPRVWGRPSLILVDFSEGQPWSPVKNTSW